ncbi:MAG: SLC13 family permease, partial [Gemmatimonadaceae bacterium]
ERARIAETLPAPPAQYRRLAIIFALTVLLWLTEPLHGIAAWKISLGAVVSLLVSQVISWRDLVRLDWGTLMLVAGGIGLGALLDRSGIVADMATALPLTNVPVTLRLLGLCLIGATLSALMSNTGTAAFLIPLAATLDPAPSTAIIVAVACSLGMPFAVSTPANAMAVAGGLRTGDLLGPGLILMIAGCVLVAFTGPFVLALVGVP